ncbi:hypothetical protein Bealeia1_00183 [Candidatus Bealeia paramacronuclearis]|uniref:Uncharacterized protein n=1 Tax=Candidatus Bealeia paramacronuclearis TaxID=1921001 RepID=A0ABZ2C2T4_9PROT
MCTLPPISFKTEYKDTIIEYVYPLLYPNRRLLMCYPRNDLSHFKIDELFTGLSHMTFGTDQIERLYKTLVCEQYLNIQYKDIKNKKDHRHTVLYTTKRTHKSNKRSLFGSVFKSFFQIVFELLPKEFNSIRNKLYDVSEFFEILLHFCTQGNPKPIGNVITYKNTFQCLCLVCLLNICSMIFFIL